MQRSAVSDGVASVPSDSLSFFEKLPPELRNAIYELSYTSDTPIKVKPMRRIRSARRDVAPGAASAQLVSIRLPSLSAPLHNVAQLTNP